MFPRRRTDQVYATLQQVQRKITEQSGSPTSAATPAGMTTPRGHGTPTPGPLPTIRPGPQLVPPDAPVPPAPLLAPGVAAHQRYAVVLSGTLATLLIVCWLASLAVAILITWQVTKPPATMSGDSGPRMPAISTPAPPAAEVRWKLIARTEPRATPEARQRLAQERDSLNEVCRRQSARGWQPWFEVEEGVNGAAALVFARQGVDKGQWQEFYALLTKQRPYAGASWVEVR